MQSTMVAQCLAPIDIQQILCMCLSYPSTLFLLVVFPKFSHSFLQCSTFNTNTVNLEQSTD